MIEPTVARAIWYYPPVAGGRDPNGEPLAATIAKVIDDRHINIGALLGDGTHFAAQNVILVQDGDCFDADQAYACWMPYQKGQAAKAEQLEQQLGSANGATGVDLVKQLTNFRPVTPAPAEAGSDAGTGSAGPQEVGITFGAALEFLKGGRRLTRLGWNGKDMFLFLVPGSTFTVNRPPLLGIYPEGTSVDYHAHIDMKTAQGYVVPWLASQADLLADDWACLPASTPAV